MRYGIPDFKMEKHYIDRRVEQMRRRGRDLPLRRQCRRRQAGRRAARPSMTRCSIAAAPRRRAPAGIPGDDLDGVHDAMPYLVQQNKRVGGEDIQSVAWPAEPIVAGGKHVVVVGGGDTASDCVGTAFRQGAVRVTQLDIRPQPPEKEEQARGLALLGDQDAHLVLAGRGRRARIPGGDARIHRRGRAADRRASAARSTRGASRSPAPNSSSAPISPSSPSASPVRSPTACSRNSTAR